MPNNALAGLIVLACAAGLLVMLAPERRVSAADPLDAPASRTRVEAALVGRAVTLHGPVAQDFGRPYLYGTVLTIADGWVEIKLDAPSSSKQSIVWIPQTSINAIRPEPLPATQPAGR